MGRTSKGAQPRAVPAAVAHDRDALVFATLTALTAIVYGQNARHAFINYDDPQLITENVNVLQGLKPPSVGWALSSGSLGWYPLTWLSHMLDVELWGVHAGAHLLTSAALHALIGCLLFLALRRMMTGTASPATATWSSAFIAALFVVHPMHVESVAWASERKDTLSTLFAVVALLFHVTAPERRTRVAVAMALSLAAKQMYVTLPLLLLLLDWWPLQRLSTRRELIDRAAEKLPLFVLAAGGVIAAVAGQQNLRTIQSTTAVPLLQRLANAAVAYVAYVGKLIVPIDLAVPYPFRSVPAPPAIAAALALTAITAFAIIARRRAPYLFTGWFWFTGTLVPVIGLVTIGSQSMADRYTYFPATGLFIAGTFAAIDLGREHRRALAFSGCAIVLVYTMAAARQDAFWKDSETLFTHTVASTGPNAIAEYCLGQTLELTRPDDAIPHLVRSIGLVERDLGTRHVPAPEWYGQAYVGLGTARLASASKRPAGPARTALITSAIGDLRRAIALDPAAPHARNNLSVAEQMLRSDAGWSR